MIPKLRIGPVLVLWSFDNGSHDTLSNVLYYIEDIAIEKQNTNGRSA